MKILDDARRLVADGFPSLEYALGCATASGSSDLDRRDWPPSRIVRVAMGTDEAVPRIVSLRLAIARLRLVHGTDWHNLSTDALHDWSGLRTAVARQENLRQPWDGTLGGVELAETRAACVRLLTSAIHHQPPKAVQAAPPPPQRPPGGWSAPAPHEREGYVPEEEGDVYNRRWEEVP